MRRGFPAASDRRRREVAEQVGDESKLNATLLGLRGWRKPVFTTDDVEGVRQACAREELHLPRSTSSPPTGSSSCRPTCCASGPRVRLAVAAHRRALSLLAVFVVVACVAGAQLLASAKRWQAGRPAGEGRTEAGGGGGEGAGEGRGGTGGGARRAAARREEAARREAKRAQAMEDRRRAEEERLRKEGEERAAREARERGGRRAARGAEG